MHIFFLHIYYAKGKWYIHTNTYTYTHISKRHECFRRTKKKKINHSPITIDHYSFVNLLNFYSLFLYFLFFGLSNWYDRVRIEQNFDILREQNGFEIKSQIFNILYSDYYSFENTQLEPIQCSIHKKGT